VENDRPPDGRERSLPARARLRRRVPLGGQVKRRTMYDTRRRKQPEISSMVAMDYKTLCECHPVLREYARQRCDY